MTDQAAGAVGKLTVDVRVRDLPGLQRELRALTARVEAAEGMARAAEQDRDAAIAEHGRESGFWGRAAARLAERNKALSFEVCICAAIRLPNGEVWRGHRHDSAILTASRAPYVGEIDIRGAEQGFITSRNRFVGRDEGARIQQAAGIMSAQTGRLPVGLLFSEDLYLRDWRSAASESTCAHTFVMTMIEMPQGYSKPGVTRCSKCGAAR